MAAAKKPTTTDDVVEVEETKSGDVKYVTVKAPFNGAKTSVPEGLVDALIASGYKK